MAALQLRRVPAEVIGREEARARGAHQIAGDIQRKENSNAHASRRGCFRGSAKSHHRAVQNFRGANAAVVQPSLGTGTPPGYYYFPGYG
jgi:hypothetical protein